jgi:adenylate cyclase
VVTSLGQPLGAAFLPAFVRQNIWTRGLEELIGTGETSRAAVLFLDVSGFTAISEALAAHGSIGIEQLTSLLNDYFGCAVQVVSDFGGDVVGFGGDSLAAVFRSINRSVSNDVAHAIGAAFQVQRSLAPFQKVHTLAGNFSLRVRAGIASGHFTWTIVGDVDVRLSLVTTGSSLDQAVAAANFATPGEVTARRSDLNQLSGLKLTRGNKQYVVIAESDLRSPKCYAKLERVNIQPSKLEPFLDDRLLEVVYSGDSSLINEHRRVTIVFASFSPSLFRAKKELHDYFRRVVNVVEIHGGHLAQIESGDKGNKFLIFFGAPRTRENDVQRAAECMIALRAIRTCAAGMTTGRAFCGLIGSPIRSEYLVMGDSVNSAARLMQLARPNVILADEPTRAAAPGFNWGNRKSVHVRGRKGLLTVSELIGGSSEEIENENRSDQMEFVGRGDELGAASKKLSLASGGKGQILLIYGEAGIGKSRLSREILHTAERLGFRGLRGECRAFGRSPMYLVWHSIFRSLFGIQNTKTSSIVDRLHDELLRVDPGLVPRIPLLGPLIGSLLPENALTKSLDPEIRLQSTKALALDCLRHSSESTPLVLLLEDCQWMDTPSMDLLEFIGRNVSDLPFALVLTSRTNTTNDEPLTTLQLPFSRFKLGGLSDADAESLAVAKLRSQIGEAADPTREELHHTIEKGRGNPFFIEELVNHLYGPSRSAISTDQAVPDTLSTLIVARIDALTASQRSVLKVGSVIGQDFTAEWINSAYPQAGSIEDIRRDLEALKTFDLTPSHPTESGPTYVFRHSLIQEVAYETLSFEARRMLHERVAAHMEVAFSSRIKDHVYELAHHYGRSNNLEKQKVFFQQAADLARENFANDLAIDFYQRLIPLLSERERTEVLCRLGEVLQLVGKWPEAEDAYKKALSLGETNQSREAIAEVWAALGYLYSYSRSFEEGLVWLEKASHEFTILNDNRGRIRVLEFLSHTYFELGDHLRAIDCATHQLALATEVGDHIGISSSNENLGRTYWHRGAHEKAIDYLKKALEAADNGHYRKGVIHAANDIAGIYSELGHSMEAMEYLQLAIKNAVDIGYRMLAGMTLGNAGHLYKERGQNDLAMACYTTALHTSTELSDWPGVFVVVGELGIFEAEIGNYRLGSRLLATAVKLGRHLKNPYFLCEFLYHQAESLVYLDEYEKGEPLLQEALSLATRLDRKDFILRSQVLEIRCKHAHGETSTPLAINAIEGLLPEWTSDDAQLLLQYHLWEFDNQNDGAKSAAAKLALRLFKSTQAIRYKRFYEELRRTSVPPATPLPGVDPTLLINDDVEGLLVRIHAMMELQQFEVAA